MKNLKHAALIGALAIAGLASATGLQAFPNFASFAEDASSGIHPGGSDIFGTGGVKDWGITCALCHINDNNQQGQISSTVTYSPALSGGKYVPGTAYMVTVKLLGEHLGMNTPTSNVNAFGLTYEDVNGNPKGTLLGSNEASCANAPTAPPAYIDGPLGSGGLTWTYKDTVNGNVCRVIGSLDHLSSSGVQTSWTFKWTAPAAGSGTVYAYWGVVDSNGDTKSTGDDVKMGKAQLAEGP